MLYDAFGNSEHLKKDWGFSVLIEYSGKKILFDTGNNSKIFAANAKALDVDLKNLDFVVISHRHGDHTSGLSHLLKVNPKVKIYAPAELFGVFGSTLPSGFYKTVDSLPESMRFRRGGTRGDPYGESVAGGELRVRRHPSGSRARHFHHTHSLQRQGNSGTPRAHLAIESPLGLVLVAGCSHPGVEEILSAASVVDSHVFMVLGGLHLVKTPNSEVERLAIALHDKWKIERIALGHCTGEAAFAKLKQVFGPSYLYAGLGSHVDLP
jgi:7,8-dihydropterin-6-yl-methyl-4-(beta-D-ribofuranosyl)aminobenzene 5'-phosphate synthase